MYMKKKTTIYLFLCIHNYSIFFFKKSTLTKVKTHWLNIEIKIKEDSYSLSFQVRSLSLSISPNKSNYSFIYIYIHPT